MVAHWMMIFTVGNLSALSLASSCFLHTRKSRQSAPLHCTVLADQDPAARARPGRAIVD
jgi:hypothetical protein